jgi:ATP-dependent protease HslVU (ClpYQ) peptidase subunit
MDGTVTSIEDEVVAIGAGGSFVAQAESEAEAEAAR